VPTFLVPRLVPHFAHNVRGKMILPYPESGEKNQRFWVFSCLRRFENFRVEIRMLYIDIVIMQVNELYS